MYSQGHSFMASPDYANNFYSTTLYPNSVSEGSLLYATGDDVIGELSLSGSGVVVANSGALSVSSDLVITSGAVTTPSQPMCMAYLSSTASNVTGDGTTYTIAFDSEVIDQASNFNTSTHAFTAPVTGMYDLTLCLQLAQVGALASTITAQAVVSGTQAATYTLLNGSAGLISGSSTVGMCSRIVVPMDSGDSVTFTAMVSGLTKTVDVVGGSKSASSVSCRLL